MVYTTGLKLLVMVGRCDKIVLTVKTVIWTVRLLLHHLFKDTLPLYSVTFKTVILIGKKVTRLSALLFAPTNNPSNF